MPLAIGPLENEHVRLEPLALEHVSGLARAATVDRSTYGLAPVPADYDQTVAYVEQALADFSSGQAVPFAIIANVQSGRREIVGATRLMSLEWWSWPYGRTTVSGEPRRKDAGDPPNVVEIGHVWIAPHAQRTPVNRAACLLLLRHVFEVWRVHRVTLKTDARNARSRKAIEGLGGKFEGILRSHLPAADGIVRDTAMFSILPSEWPAVKVRLLDREGRPG